MPVLVQTETERIADLRGIAQTTITECGYRSYVCLAVENGGFAQAAPKVFLYTLAEIAPTCNVRHHLVGGNDPLSGSLRSAVSAGRQEEAR